MQFLEREHVACVVATGGFVSGPAIVAAARRKIPRVLVNLDAVPGQANRRLAGLCTKVFSPMPATCCRMRSASDFPARSLGRRDVARGCPCVTRARRRAPHVVHHRSHPRRRVADQSDDGVHRHPERAAAFEGWQVFHQCGTFDVDTLQRAYDDAGVKARVVDYCGDMGAAYRAATVVISRAGAGSVAEAWANHAPTIFLPNPYHKDQHQRHNAEPMVQAGGALLVTDHVDADATANDLSEPLLRLLRDSEARNAMTQACADSCPPDGAEQVAAWIDDNA